MGCPAPRGCVDLGVVGSMFIEDGQSVAGANTGGNQPKALPGHLPARPKNCHEHPLPVLVCYRSNGLFKQHVPEVLRALKENGYKVEELSFPEGTEQSEIITQLRARRAKVSRSIVLSDETVKSCLEQLGGDFGRLCGALDVAATSSTSECILSRFNVSPMDFQYGVDFEKARTVYEQIFAAALHGAARQGLAPNRIVIVSAKLEDHGPFSAERSFVTADRANSTDEYRLRVLTLGTELREWTEGAIALCQIAPGPELNVVADVPDVIDLGLDDGEIVWILADVHSLQEGALRAGVRESALSEDDMPVIDATDTQSDSHLDDEIPLSQAFFNLGDADASNADPRLGRRRRRGEQRTSWTEQRFREELAYRLKDEEQTERNLRQIGGLARSFPLRMAGALESLGVHLDPVSEEFKAEPLSHRSLIPLPIGYMISFFERSKLLGTPECELFGESSKRFTSAVLSFVREEEVRRVVA